jgi:GR25 family glycosyltransferase involved in LPS biosynthesis
MRNIKIICLTLPKDNVRRDMFLKNFSCLGIPIEFHFGVDASAEKVNIPQWLQHRNLHPSYSEKSRCSIPELSDDLSPPNIACAIGHLEIWRKVESMPSGDFCLICEDDSILVQDFDVKGVLEEILEMTDTDLFIYLGFITQKDKRSKISKIIGIIRSLLAMKFWTNYKQKRLLINRILIQDPFRSHNKSFGMYKAGLHWGGFGYLITPGIATELIELNREIKMTSDGTFRYARLLNLFKMLVIIPGLIRVNVNVDSNIRSKEENNSVFNDYEFG